MSNHVLLDNITHQTLRVVTDRAAEYGDNISLTTVFPIEFQRLQGQYPIFFNKGANDGEYTPVALLGFESYENLFLQCGDWSKSYIPLSIQRQPFLIGFQSNQDGGKSPVVHIDMDHPRISHSEGQWLFLEQGGTSEYLDGINSTLMAIHQGYEANQAFIADLVRHDLIEPFTLDITLDAGDNHKLVGLHTINEDVLNALSQEALKSLHDKGYLNHIFMIIASIANVQSLIDMKNSAQ